MSNIAPFRDDTESRLIVAEAEIDTLRKENEKLVKKLELSEGLVKIRPHLRYAGLAFSVTAMVGGMTAAKDMAVGLSMGVTLSVAYGLYFFFAVWNWLYKNWSDIWP